jgi:hypothetical protein
MPKSDTAPTSRDVIAVPLAPQKLSRKERREAKKRAAQVKKEIRKQLLEAHPELVKIGRDAGFDDDKIVDWIVKLSPIPIDDKELVKIGEQGIDAPAPVSATRRQLTIWRHQIAHWWNHGKGLQRIIYGGLWVSLLWNAVMRAGLGWFGYGAGIIVLGAKLKVVIGEIDPKHLPLFQRTLNERQLMLRNLLTTIQQWRSAPPSRDQLKAFQVDALRLIASLVRDHRSDLGGRKIFVNLIVHSGDGVEVVARANDNRQVPMRYTKEQCSIAWKAFETGLPQVTGDLYADARKTSPGKSYKSVLALPVKLRDSVMAVVSIDSELKHHFHGHFDNLLTLVGPYVQLIASSLIEDHAMRRPPPEGV